MTATPIFDDLTAHRREDEVPQARRTTGGGIVVPAGRRPSPGPRRMPVPDSAPADATAFGQGCLEEPGRAADDGLAPFVEAARREVEALGHGRVGTEHLLLAVVRSGGEVGRAFGLRRAGAAVVAAACAGCAVTEPLVAPDGAPALTVAAAGALARARARAAGRERPPTPADLGLALIEAGRSARLLDDLGVDLPDLADVLSREDLDLPEVPPVRADVRPPVPAPTPVGTLAPVALMLPSPTSSSASRAGAVTAPLRIGPPPGSPARRSARGRGGVPGRPQDRPALDLPA